MENTPKTPTWFKQPNSSLSDLNLTYRDVLTYGGLISFCNKELMCYPSITTLARRTKLSLNFLYQSIQRLEAANLLKVHKVPTGDNFRNVYQVFEFKEFKMIPREIFESNLKADEMAILLCIRRFFCDETQLSVFSVKTMAKQLGISYNTLAKKVASLKEGGYLDEVFSQNILNTKLMNKDFDWKVKVDKKLEEHNNLLVDLDKRTANMERLMELFQKQFSTLAMQNNRNTQAASKVQLKN